MRLFIGGYVRKQSVITHQRKILLWKYKVRKDAFQTFDGFMVWCHYNYSLLLKELISVKCKENMLTQIENNKYSDCINRY